MSAASGDFLAGDFQGQTAPTTRGRLRGHWVLRRLAVGLFVLFLVSVLVFFATQALPGDPVSAILGRDQNPENVAALRHALDLDQSLLSQYWSWLSGVLQGDLGRSLISNDTVWSTINDGVVNSLILLVLAGVIGIPLSIALGTISAARRDGALDKSGLVGSLVLTAIPPFVIGVALVIVFATTIFTVLPSVTLLPPGDSPIQHPDQLVLPVATLVLAIVPYLFRLSRASMIDVLESDYIAMARLKGVPERTVLWRHALPNSLIPSVQAAAVVLSYLLGGVVIIEVVFNYPGLGSALSSAVDNRDLPVIQAIILLFAASVVIFNLIADVMTVYLTPRLRTARRR